MKIGFDHEKYLKEQSKYILERVEKFDKLYLEKEYFQDLMKMPKSRFYNI